MTGLIKNLKYAEGTEVLTPDSLVISSGAGELNYIEANPSGETNLDGWSESTVGQVDITRTETAADLPREVLTGTGLKIIGTGSTGTNEYVKFPFLLDDADVSKKLKIAFAKKDISGYVAGELEVLIRDVTNSVTITPATSAIPEGTGEFLTSFDTTTSLSYEFWINKPLAATTAGIVISDLIVGPGKVVQGAIVTEWAAYTPNTSGVGTPTIALASYSRVGDSTDIKIRFTAGTTTATPAQIGLPGTITGFPSSMIVGSWYIHDTATPKKGPLIAADGFDYLLFGRDDGTNQPLTAVNGDNIFTSGDLIVVTTDIAIPIAEWAGSGTLNVGTNDVEYAYNSSTSTTASDTTSFAYGQGGAQIKSITAALTRRVEWQHAIQAGDRISIEISEDQISWYPLSFISSGNVLIASGDYDGTATYGVATKDVSTTQTDVQFYINRVSGTNWSSAANFYWRVVKTKSGAAVGFGLASASESGLVSRESTELVDASDASGFTGGSFRCTRVGNLVTLSETTQITWTGTLTPSSTTAIIPEGYRPTRTINQVYFSSSSAMAKVEMLSTGVFVHRTYNYGGTAQSTSGTHSGWSISYHTDD